MRATSVIPERSPACASGLALDRWLVGELGPDEVRALEAHVAACARCAARKAALEVDRGRFRASRPSFAALVGVAAEAAGAAPAPARPARPGLRRLGLAAGGAGLALAAAAAIVLVARPRPAGPTELVRTKGAARVGAYRKHGDAVAPVASGDRVAAGDALRFTYTTREPRYLALLGRDGRGAISTVYPDGPRAAPVDPGEDVALPGAWQLDDVPGDERFFAVFCDRPLELDRVRDALARGGELAVTGCTVDVLTLAKEPR